MPLNLLGTTMPLNHKGYMSQQFQGGFYHKDPALYNAQTSIKVNPMFKKTLSKRTAQLSIFCFSVLVG